MKRLFAALLLLFITSTASQAQFRSDLSKVDPPLNTADAMKGQDFLSTLFDPSHFSMHQSFSSSFISGGGGSLGISMFTNTFSFHPSSDLYVSADLSAVYSPFSSFGSAYSNSLNGVYLTSARLDWKLSDNAFMRVEYLGGPTAGMYGAYSPYYNPFYEPSAPMAPGGFAAGAGVKVH
jgi:hypothetical protein